MGAKATFFVCGNLYGCLYDLDRTRILEKAFYSGHQIASHTWSHPALDTLSPEWLHGEMATLETTLDRILGLRPRWMRPPYGRVNDTVRAKMREMGYKIALWDADSEDWNGASCHWYCLSYAPFTECRCHTGGVARASDSPWRRAVKLCAAHARPDREHLARPWGRDRTLGSETRIPSGHAFRMPRRAAASWFLCTFGAAADSRWSMEMLKVRMRWLHVSASVRRSCVSYSTLSTGCAADYRGGIIMKCAALTARSVSGSLPRSRTETEDGRRTVNLDHSTHGAARRS